MDVLIMVVSAAAIILLVKYGLLRGIDNIASAMQWSAKARGQATGYTTSIPELVCLVSTGFAGVWEAGLWNIASSNIINAGLMLLAVLKYRQFGELFNRRFFAVYATASKEGKLESLSDTQEALDNLTGSNMANVGVVYPIGLAAFLLASALLGGG